MKRFLAGTAAVTAFLLALTMSVFVSYASAATDTVTVNGQTKTTNGTDIYRAANFLVRYTPAYGATTGTNEYGAEAVVVNGVVTQLRNGVGNVAIPANGYVLSGHGTSRTWLVANATVGKTVTLNGSTPPPSGTEKLPDVGIRTLRQFQIVNTGGKKLLKFPGVTANVGQGPLEVNATRSSSTSTDWVGVQKIYLSSGGFTTRPTNQEFYWGGDGHNHHHMRDFDAYELFDPNGKKLADGEKHGFCFEDNTQYRNWPGNPKFPAAPANPVYTQAGGVCGIYQPNATTIQHGLSVGWADTYPATLPDQAIDITGLPDGIYVVKITADQGGWIKETNESNNSATGRIQITGNTVTLLQANDGL